MPIRGPDPTPIDKNGRNGTDIATDAEVESYISSFSASCQNVFKPTPDEPNYQTDPSKKERNGRLVMRIVGRDDSNGNSPRNRKDR